MKGTDYTLYNMLIHLLWTYTHAYDFKRKGIFIRVTLHYRRLCGRVTERCWECLMRATLPTNPDLLKW